MFLDKNLNRNLNCLVSKDSKNIVLLSLTLSQGQFFNLTLDGLFKGLLQIASHILSSLDFPVEATQKQHGAGSPTQLVGINWEAKSRKEEVEVKQGENAGSKTTFLVASPPGPLAG